ncbi:hypothetical protein BDF20DRAFT_908286 [Mycotypha africana]|uniref:uncharacterized protein n=1 Tax=Mycotypha africana TaxID=64632 RepID=UPI0023001272|nr:uncharacterized protein BDF20DRAFT_908286 [Mycotypha africana]KAI8967704.1 hypothetical protein BDF20DRAFT_908286 [Mycotypha africana]
MHTHLAQYQASCWKYWGISAPFHLFEKKENDRTSPAYMGWWGPAKGVPMLVLVAANLQFEDIVPATIKKMQDSLQTRVKSILRSTQLISVNSNKIDRDRGGGGQGFKHHHQPPPPVEVKSLFLLPSGSQPIIHIVPASTEQMRKEETIEYSFDQVQPLSHYMQLLKEPEHSPSVQLYHDYSEKLLRNYVAIWTKAATLRHPLHNNQNNFTSRKANNGVDAFKSAPLPTAMHFVSAIVPLLSFLFGRSILQDGRDFNKKVIVAENSSTKGMIQQIEVILRKKIRDHVEIETVFSKSRSLKIMKKCLEIYLQDSPPFYPERYHLLKRAHVLRLYHSLARGPCMLDYANELERECDTIWKSGREGCEHISLTEKACRLKLGHEHAAVKQKTGRDERSTFVDPKKHNSGFTLFHACSCGKTQGIREDPFDLDDANDKFYRKFGCCLGPDRAAVDIAKSTFGDRQHLVLNSEELPPGNDIALIYLGPSTIYKNNVGLDKVGGFMSNTNFLIPWSITTIEEIKSRKNQEAVDAAEVNEKRKTEATNSSLKENANAAQETEWPTLGQQQSVQPTATAPSIALVPSLDAFPVLGTDPTTTTTSTVSSKDNSTMSLARPSKSENKQLRRYRSRERLQGLIRGYVGAEYECPLGHRFFSCGQGRVCKLGHKDHPKEHGNYFVHQDLPVYIVCPCSYANTSSTNMKENNTATAAAMEVTAQLQRLYVVTPDEAVTITLEPKITIFMEDAKEPLQLNLGMNDYVSLAPGSMYVLRLPFIYRDSEGNPIRMSNDVQKRLKSAILQKDYIKFHYKEAEKWTLNSRPG